MNAWFKLLIAILIIVTALSPAIIITFMEHRKFKESLEDKNNERIYHK